MKGVIFDWDGVVIDSSAEHERSWEILSEEISRPLPEGHFKRGFGKKNEVIIPEILGWAKDLAEISKLAERKETIYRELVRDRGVQILPGARELLVALCSEKIPRAARIASLSANPTPRAASRRSTRRRRSFSPRPWSKWPVPGNSSSMPTAARVFLRND